MSERSRMLVERLRGGRKLTVAIRDVEHVFGEVLPHLARDVSSRAHLLEVLREAEGEGELRLNKSRFDRFARPYLPATVVLARIEGQEPGRRRRSLAVRPDLEWALQVPLSDEEAAFVVAVNRFLRDLREDEPVIPMRERSLEIAGDEKVIQGLLGGRLFAEGRLSLGMLRCSPTTPPFGYAEVGPPPVLLVVENQDTYWSLRRLIRPEHGIGLVAFGAGHVFASSVLYICELPRVVERVIYFGDVDGRGLETPVVAGLVAERWDLPRVEACGRLYRLLFSVAQPQPSPAKALSASTARRRAGWLPAGLQAEAVRLLTTGQRLAQEAVSYKVLASTLAEPIDLSTE